ncbi:hypothetical protein BKA59DRAFT_436996 [Fusarium tricinctum]|uniref:FAD-binding domain-containing protein n=1 Tax=Fusarium tricinctum TaxID=61284 RepID=A0A8K0S742_9HYPO|nr:hypothetical protein BKA59DRAFT_436996 [Fusarium tricinctum]
MVTPLKVIIVGAGIGGLTAAAGLRKEGHEVILLERSQLAQESGAAMHLAPNCHGILKRFGIFPETVGANRTQGITEFEYTGDLRATIDLQQANLMWQHPWVLCHRVKLHEALKEKATTDDNEGPGAILRLSSQVVDVDPYKMTVTLQNGDQLSGDLILGADGVGSVVRKAVVGNHIKPFNAGKGAFRFLIPKQQLFDHPATRQLVSKPGYMTFWYANDRRLVMYPCDDNTTMNFIAMHPYGLSASEAYGFSHRGSKETLLRVYKDFCAVVQTLLNMVDEESLKLWTLLDMDRIPYWVKGGVALLGDAAHPFLPCGVAIEDSASICALFPRNTTKEEVTERLALYERIRDERAHRIQAATRSLGTDLDENKANNTDNMVETTRYNFGHDEWHNSKDALRRWIASRNESSLLRRPTAFWPISNLEGYGLPQSTRPTESYFLKQTVRFKTSATYLQALFPTPNFKFSSPGTVVEAAFQCLELFEQRKGERSAYKSLVLQVHGVQFTKRDGTKLDGSYTPVMFESIPNIVISHREELGLPSFHCDIEVVERNKTFHITCSLMGKSFIDLQINTLQETVPETSTETSCDNQFAYRYVPTVGTKGFADAEYPILLRGHQIDASRKLERTLRGTSAIINASKGAFKAMSAFNCVTAGLAELPIYGIVETKLEQGYGAITSLQAKRIE